MRFDDVLKLATQTAYPEPESQLHTTITKDVVKVFTEFCKPPATVLDVGCGSCNGSKELRELGYNVTPISVLENEVEAAKSLGFDARIAEMHDTLSLGRFDAVWLRHVAEHSPCPLLLLSNFAAQADWLYIEVPLPETSAHHEMNPNHYSVLAPRGWINLLQRTGWEIIGTQEISFKLECGDDCYIFFVCKNKAKL